MNTALVVGAILGSGGLGALIAQLWKAGPEREQIIAAAAKEAVAAIGVSLAECKRLLAEIRGDLASSGDEYKREILSAAHEVTKCERRAFNAEAAQERVESENATLSDENATLKLAVKSLTERLATLEPTKGRSQ